MASGREHVGKFFPHPKCADRKSSAERFRHRDRVRHKLDIFFLENALPALEFSGPKVAGLHFIEHQHQIVLVTEFAQPDQVFRTRHCDSALALNRFD
jgi:hypothetical protein